MLKRIACLMLLLSALTIAKAGQPLDKIIAIVNDDVVTESELTAQVRLMQQQLEAKHIQIPPEKVLRKQVLQHLIDVNLELQLAKKNNMTVDNTELNAAIEKIASNNHLSTTQLREAITQQGLTWQDYRESIRKELLINQLQQKAIHKDIKISQAQVEDYLKTAVHEEVQQLTYHIQNIVIPLSEEPSTEELKKANTKAKEVLAKSKQVNEFEPLIVTESTHGFNLEGGDLGSRHLAELPEVFSTHILKMKPGDVAGPIRAGNGLHLIKLIAIGGDSGHHAVLKTHVRHILLKPDNNMTAQEAKKQALNLYQQLKSGKHFASIAKHHSLDVVSAAKGGDLGWVTSGELVPEFEKVMDKLPLHQVSQPVKTRFGWHLIEVLERKKIDDSESFKRQQIRQFLQQRKFMEAVQDWQHNVRAHAYVKVIDKALA